MPIMSLKESIIMGNANNALFAELTAEESTQVNGGNNVVIIRDTTYETTDQVLEVKGNGLYSLQKGNNTAILG
jgi:hypothetical protein